MSLSLYWWWFALYWTPNEIIDCCLFTPASAYIHLQDKYWTCSIALSVWSWMWVCWCLLTECHCGLRTAWALWWKAALYLDWTLNLSPNLCACHHSRHTTSTNQTSGCVSFNCINSDQCFFNLSLVSPPVLMKCNTKSMECCLKGFPNLILKDETAQSRFDLRPIWGLTNISLAVLVYFMLILWVLTPTRPNCWVLSPFTLSTTPPTWTETAGALGGVHTVVQHLHH